MQYATLAEPRSRPLVVSEFCDRVEEVLRTSSREGARALLPDLRAMARRIDRLRSLDPSCSGIGLSKYVIAVAALAGRREEFAAYA